VTMKAINRDRAVTPEIKGYCTAGRCQKRLTGAESAQGGQLTDETGQPNSTGDRPLGGSSQSDGAMWALWKEGHIGKS
jgi:hypothetical protein